ncbi:MAG TPA: NAD(P)H-hydrate dehydratase [Ferruginibacter sp.]|nr:NAD(P)H-hydrate dehydratase [Ferruginibacter sp.]
MKIFSAAQIRKWDECTIANEPVSSIDLMERAASACCKWLIGKNFGHLHFRIFCGKGNNGGDGLAIARMLAEYHCRVTVYILEFGNIGTKDFQLNLERLHLVSTDIHFIQSADFFPVLDENDLVIDAMLGSGLNKPLEGIIAALADHINRAAAEIISIDLPTGLFADRSSAGNTIISATHILTFQNQKLAFLLAENETHCGEVHLLNIGLDPLFEKNEPAGFELVDQTLIKSMYKPRSKFAHKGIYGHAALVCGSKGMMGAAVLSSLACLRSGAGKLTSIIPACGYEILQTSVPEAMCIIDGEETIVSAPGIEKFDAIGIGPGIGMSFSHKDLLSNIFARTNKPLVIDADALNCIAANKSLLKAIPPLSVITPHPKEFERLFGSSANDMERLDMALQRSKELNIYIVVKGHYSFIASPSGIGYFNSTGNAGMATAGSGDVLTGLITGLLANGYEPLNAALLGVYLHGSAGDHAAELYSKEAMIAGDIIGHLGDAFKEISL